MNELAVLRDGFWRSTRNKSPIEKDFVLGMYNDLESIWIFRCFRERGFVPVCAEGTTQSDAIYVSHFYWLPYADSTDWHTDIPPKEEPIVGIRYGSDEPEMLVYVLGQYRTIDINTGTDDDSEVVDCVKWIDLPAPPSPMTKKEKKLALRNVN